MATSTTYNIYKVADSDAPNGDVRSLDFVKSVDAASGPAAIKAGVPAPEIGKRYAAIPVRNITIKTAKQREVPPVLFA